MHLNRYGLYKVDAGYNLKEYTIQKNDGTLVPYAIYKAEEELNEYTYLVVQISDSTYNRTVSLSTETYIDTITETDWGDGTIDDSNEHTYSYNGIYTIKTTRYTAYTDQIIEVKRFSNVPSSYSLAGSRLLTKVAEIPDNITDCESMFSSCTSLNCYVNIPNNAINCKSMFEGCRVFNQPVTIPNGVINCSYMFDGCRVFNQPIIIPNGVENTFSMFGECYKFNSEVTIPDSVTYCAYMFYHCEEFNQDIVVPPNSSQYNYMFGYCNSLNKVIDIPYTNVPHLGMFQGCTSLTDIGYNNYNIMQSYSGNNYIYCYKDCTSIVNPITYETIKSSYSWWV